MVEYEQRVAPRRRAAAWLAAPWPAVQRHDLTTVGDDTERHVAREALETARSRPVRFRLAAGWGA